MRRVKGKFALVIIGAVMFIACTIMLFKNEGRAVNRARALSNIKDAIEVSSTDTNLEDGKMILISDVVKGKDSLKDDLFEVSAPKDAIKMSRDVKMYQWKEKSSSKNDKKTYTYEEVWSDTLIDSSRFEHSETYKNPKTMKYKSEKYVTNKAELGSYTVGKTFINKINKKEDLTNIKLLNNVENMKISNNTIFISNKGESSIESPEIGDYLIEYVYVPADTITLLGQKKGTQVISYNTKHGELAEVSYGNLSKESLQEQKIQDNKTNTIVIRIVLIIGIMIANSMVVSPLTSVLSYIPVLGRLVNSGIGIIGFILGLLWSVVVISIGWIVFRPFVGIGLLIMVGGVIFFIMKKGKEKEESALISEG